MYYSSSEAWLEACFNELEQFPFTWLQTGGGHVWILSLGVTSVAVSKVTGRVEVEDVVAAIRPTTCLVSVMTANNETGIIMVRVCTTLIQYYTTYMLFILGDGCQNSQYVGHPLQIEKNILSVFLCGSESM